MRKPSAPRPEPSSRSEGRPASIPPRRSGNRRARPARSGQGGAGQSDTRRSQQSTQTQRGAEPPEVGPDRRPRAPGAGTATRSPGGDARTASSKGGSRSAISGKQTGDGSSKPSRIPEATTSQSAPGTELTVFGRRQVALPKGDDRVVSTGLADRLKERQQALRRLRLRRVTTAAIVVLVVALATWALLLSPLLGLQPQRISVAGSDGSVSDRFAMSWHPIRVTRYCVWTPGGSPPR